MNDYKHVRRRKTLDQLDQAVQESTRELIDAHRGILESIKNTKTVLANDCLDLGDTPNMQVFYTKRWQEMRGNIITHIREIQEDIHLDPKDIEGVKGLRQVQTEFEALLLQTPITPTFEKELICPSVAL